LDWDKIIFERRSSKFWLEEEKVNWEREKPPGELYDQKPRFFWGKKGGKRGKLTNPRRRRDFIKRACRGIDPPPGGECRYTHYEG